MNVKKNHKLALFTTKDYKVQLDVKINKETVWLTQEQMSLLFDTARSSIAYHIEVISKVLPIALNCSPALGKRAFSVRTIYVSTLKLLLPIARRSFSNLFANDF